MVSREFKRRAVGSLCLLGAMLALASPAETALKEMSFEELTRTASRVVHGKVVDLHSFYGVWSHPDDQVIVTEVTIEPLGVLKGEAARPIVFRIAGGTVGDVSMTASEGPAIENGQEMVVFLARHSLGFEFIYAHWHGKYDVHPVPGRTDVRRVRGIPGAPLSRNTSLEELTARVREVERKAQARKAAAEKEEKK